MIMRHPMLALLSAAGLAAPRATILESWHRTKLFVFLVRALFLSLFLSLLSPFDVLNPDISNLEARELIQHIYMCIKQ